jgi:hypothetical protein
MRGFNHQPNAVNWFGDFTPGERLFFFFFLFLFLSSSSNIPFPTPSLWSKSCCTFIPSVNHLLSEIPSLITFLQDHRQSIQRIPFQTIYKPSKSLP